MKQLRPLILILVALTAISYLGGIAWAGIASLGSEAMPKIPEVITQAITVIGAALATHFGAIFGIATFTGGNPRPIPPRGRLMNGLYCLYGSVSRSNPSIGCNKLLRISM